MKTQVCIHVFGKNVDGVSWSLKARRIVEIPCVLPYKSEIKFKIDSDDPVSPEYVTVRQYGFNEGDSFVWCTVNERIEAGGEVSRYQFAKMLVDRGWTV